MRAKIKVLCSTCGMVCWIKILADSGLLSERTKAGAKALAATTQGVDYGLPAVSGIKPLGEVLQELCRETQIVQ